MKASLKKTLVKLNPKKYATAIISGIAVLMLSSCSSSSPSSKQALIEAQKAPAKSSVQELLIGTYTDEGSNGVYKLTFSPAKNQLVNSGLVAKATQPLYLAQTANNKEFYSIVGKKNGGMSYYQWHEKKQRFVIKSQLAKLSQGACHIALNPQGTQAAVADYATGEVYLVALNKAEKQQSLILLDTFKNSGKSITPRQKSPHSHYVQWDKSGKFLYAVDLGTEEILLFETGKGQQLSTPRIAAKLSAGDGPRHMAFHPNKNIIYVLNELSNVVAVFQQNTATGQLTLTQRISALPEKTVTKNQQASFSSAIKASNDGRFIYAAVRGENAIAVFEIGTNGELSFIQSHSTLGNWPRDMTISANQDYIFIANKLSNEVTVLKRDIKNGLLSPTTMKVDISLPAYIGIF